MSCRTGHPAQILVRFVVSAASLAVFQSVALADADESVVVSASRFPESALARPLSITVLGAEEIRASAAPSLPALLAEQAGITLQDVNGNGGISATVDIRGFGATAGQNTLILLDGRRLTDLDQANVNWSSIPLGSIERIEILRGSGAVQFGEGAGGGVINIVSRAPGEGDPAMVGGRFGSYNTREFQAGANRKAGAFGLSVGGSHYESDGYRVNNHARQTNATLKAGYDYGTGSLRLGLDANWMTMRLPGFRQVEPAVGRDDLATDLRGTPTPNDDSARRGAQFALDWRHRFDFGELAIDYTRRTREQWIYSEAGQFARLSDMTLDSLSPRLRLPHALFGAKSQLVLGADWQDWDYAARDAVTIGLMSQPYSRVSARQSNIGYYLQETVDIGDRLSVLAGARLERQKLSASNTVDLAATCPFGFCPTAAAPDAATHWQSAWELGGRYRLSAQWSAFAKTARAFRFNNVDEIYETDAAFNNQFQFLRPQTNHLVELGVQWATTGSSVKAAIYRNDVRDEIHLDPFTAGVGNTNLPASRRAGVELEGRWQAADSLRVDGSATWTDARFLEGVYPGGGALNSNVSGKNVPLVPKRKFNLGADWRFLPRTHAKASVTYVGEQYMDNDEANSLGTKMPAYTLVNFRLDHDTGDMLLALTLNNLTNQKYYAYAVKSPFFATRFSAYPLPERSLYVSAEYRFR